MIPDSFLAYREVHAVMLANGDDKPIWMTELSWRTTSAECEEGAFAGQKAQGVSDDQQATYLSQAYNCLAQDALCEGRDLVSAARRRADRLRAAARKRLA